jgi:hypothetical protein
MTPPLQILPGNLAAPSSSPDIDLMAWIRIGLFLLSLAIAVIVVVLGRRKLKANQPASRAWNVPITSQVRSLVNRQVAGMLTILNSDDEAIVNKKLYVLSYPVTFGRQLDNNVSLPKDKAVSRSHARLELHGDKVMLIEIMAHDGDTVRPPTFGTFVNGLKVQGPTAIRPGDEVRLGKRFSFRLDPVTDVDDSILATEQYEGRK